MRRGTILFLLALVLLVAFFGLLKAIGILVAVLVGLVVLAFASVFLGAWLLKRRMRRKLAELHEVIAQAQRQAEHERRGGQVRAGAIDAEFEAHDERK